MAKIKVVTSVVTYNNEKIISQVLDSIIKSKTACEVEVVVVDNNSSDKTVEIVKENFPSVKVIRNKNNLGYGAGHNKAINSTTSKYHMIINPDITFDETFIQDAINYMEKNPEVVLFNPDIRDVNGERKFPVKAEPHLHYIIPRVFKWNNPLFNRWRDEYTYKSKFREKPFEVEVCSGSFMVCRKDALDDVGGFDERFFLYYEDFDLSKMLKKKGKIVCNPTIAVVHVGARAAHHSKKARRLMINSLVAFYKKWGWKL